MAVKGCLLLMTMTMRVIIDIHKDVDLIKSAGILSFSGRCALVLLVERCPKGQLAVVAGSAFTVSKIKCGVINIFVAIPQQKRAN